MQPPYDITTHFRDMNDERHKRGKQQLGTMELYCQAIEHAVESWGLVQKIPDYETVVGELLFRQ